MDMGESRQTKMRIESCTSAALDEHADDGVSAQETHGDGNCGCDPEMRAHVVRQCQALLGIIHLGDQLQSSAVDALALRECLYFQPFRGS